MGETMLLVDAQPGDVLVDREGDVWRCTEAPTSGMKSCSVPSAARGARMYLSQADVRALLPVLERFARTGEVE